MTVDDFLKICLGRWRAVVSGLLFGLGVATGVTLLQTPVYASTATGYVTTGPAASTADAYTGALLAQKKAQGYLPLVTSRAVAARVITDLGLSTTPQALVLRIKATLPTDGVNITVTATAGSPIQAQRLADAVVRASAAEAAKVDDATKSVGGAQLVPVESAVLPSQPTSPRPKSNLLLGGIAGFLLGLGLAALLHRRDTRIRAIQAVEDAAHSSVLGVVPRSIELATRRGADLSEEIGDFHTREALRQLRTNLRFINIDDSPRVIVVTSARMGEGKSTISAHLSMVLAASGQAVVLMDADLRRPSIASFFKVDPSVGLTQVLTGGVSLEDALQDTSVPGLRVLAAGLIPPNPSELVGSHRMAALLRTIAADALLVVDAPPLLPVTDATLLAASADGALLVVAAGETRVEHVRQAAAAIARVDARLLGVVVNKLSSSRFGRLAGADVDYGYGTYEPYEPDSRHSLIRRR